MNSFDKITESEMNMSYRNADYRQQCRVIRTAGVSVRDTKFLHEIAGYDYPTYRDAIDAVRSAAEITC
jgi:hypothetical protein